MPIISNTTIKNRSEILQPVEVKKNSRTWRFHLLLLLLLFIGIAPSFSGVTAEIPNPISNESSFLKFSAAARIRGELLRNRNFSASNDDLRYILARFRLGFEFTPEEDTHIFIQPQFSHSFGQTEIINQNLTSITNTNGASENVPTGTVMQTSGSTYDPSLSVHQAFIEHHFSPHLDIKLGRQEMNYGDQLVVGASDWDNTARSFDTLLVHSIWGVHSIDAWAVKNIDRNIKVNAEGDQDFYGIYSMWNIGDYLKALDVYSFFLRDPSTSNNLKIFAAGLRAKSQIDQFDYRLESTLEKGRRGEKSMDGVQADIELGYGFNNAFNFFQKIRISFEGFFSSKDYHQLYPTGHKWLGYLDIFGRRNIMGLVEHIHSEFNSIASVDIDLHHFFRADSAFSLYKLDGISTLGSGSRTDSKIVGTELDLTGRFVVSKAIALKTGGSFFFPTQYLASEVGTRTAMKGFVEIEAKY